MAATATAAAPPVREPAPPPASCRTEPTSSWPALVAGGTTPDLVPYQDYRAGLALADGADGAGVRIGDVEYEWLPSHLELAPKALPASAPTGLPAGYQVRDHGTAVLGVLGGTADGQGITGIAPEATLMPVSPFVSGVYRPAEAITAAAAGLGAGDVLLVELQAMSGTGAMVPIEVYPEVRKAIAAAVDRGIVVVEPAANSGRDLATIPLDASLGPNPWAPGTAGEDDSGALIVGAGGSGSPLSNVTSVADRQRTPESNFGARVDLQGFGAGVVTGGYADLPGRRRRHGLHRLLRRHLQRQRHRRRCGGGGAGRGDRPLRRAPHPLRGAHPARRDRPAAGDGRVRRRQHRAAPAGRRGHRGHRRGARPRPRAGADPHHPHSAGGARAGSRGPRHRRGPRPRPGRHGPAGAPRGRDDRGRAQRGGRRGAPRWPGSTGAPAASRSRCAGSPRAPGWRSTAAASP